MSLQFVDHVVLTRQGKRTAWETFALILLGMLPFGLLLDASFIGQLFATELIFLVVIPALWISANSTLHSTGRHLLWWIFAWFLAQFATDLYVNALIGDYLRGWAKLIFFGIDVYVLLKLLINENRILLWGLSWNVAFGISVWLQFDDLSIRWKYGLGIAVVNALVCAALLLWPKRQVAFARMGAALCIGFAGASLFLNARNTFLNLGMAGMLLTLTSIPRTRQLLTSIWDKNRILLLVSVLAVAYLAGEIYVEGASRGVFGDDARLKLKAQENDTFGPVLGVLAGGRTEFNASFVAIGDSPIVGYGSGARSAYYYNIYLENIRETGTPEQIAEVNSKISTAPQIPTHSHLFGAWVETGIIGAAFWFMILRLVLRATRRSMNLVSSVDVLVMLNAPLFIWNVLFSPFGGEMRLVNATLLAFFCFIPDKRPGDHANPLDKFSDDTGIASI